jgi:hypothetical protein
MDKTFYRALGDEQYMELLCREINDTLAVKKRVN